LRRKQKKPLSWDTAPDILTVEEAACLVRIPRNSAYEAIRLGLLPAANFGRRRIRVSKAVLQEVFGLRSESGATAAFSLPEAYKNGRSSIQTRQE
jgi:excisionase family DNA binding protein